MTLIKRNGNWTAVESIAGKRRWYSTKTPNKKLAEKRAKVFYDALRAENLAAVDLLVNKKGNTIPTFKELFEYLEEQSGCRKSTTIEYINCLKLIITETKGKYDEDANVILSGKIISDWEKLRHNQSKGVLGLHAAKRTVYSTVRKAKCVFTKKMLQRYLDAGMQIDVKDFLARSVENGPSVRYKAPKDESLAARTFKASESLKDSDPNAFIAFTLAMQAGLRKSEIANAKVSWIEDHVVHVQPQEDYDTKNSHGREIPINPQCYSLLVSFLSNRKPDEYILEGNKTERTEDTFRRLNKWLADLGWTHSNKRTHELRKWYGSQVAKLGGIHAAQHLLGHMDYSTTDRYYADPQANIVVNQ
tara:strand:+ start:858 stop:1937 length:1080 start_codon:yes stop_codon:yes gene_type:complete